MYKSIEAKYPEKFVVEFNMNNNEYYSWDVKYSKLEDKWMFTNQSDGGCIGGYKASMLDTIKTTEGYKFIFPEPVLVFPMVVQTTLPPYYIYRITRGDPGRINIEVDGGKYASVYPDSYLKDNIKSGNWIVKSVGELSEAEGKYNPPKDNVSNLKITVTSEGVTKTAQDLNALAQAAENVNIALESMQQIMTDMGLSNFAKVTCASDSSFPPIDLV